jgi:hypothetical protein
MDGKVDEHMSKRITARLTNFVILALIGLACAPLAITQPKNTPASHEEAMLQKVQQYARDNYLPSTSGTYQRLNDQIHYNSDTDHSKWTDTGLVLEDFVYESDLAWENTTETIGDNPAGCGLLFHSNGNNNYIIALIGLDGNIYMGSVINGELQSMDKSHFGKVQVSQGNTHIALVVSGIHYTFFVNDKKIMQNKSEADNLKTGQLIYVVFSGSDKGVGTTCKFTNIDLWTVKP